VTSIHDVTSCKIVFFKNRCHDSLCNAVHGAHPTNHPTPKPSIRKAGSELGAVSLFVLTYFLWDPNAIAVTSVLGQTLNTIHVRAPRDFVSYILLRLRLDRFPRHDRIIRVCQTVSVLVIYPSVSITLPPFSIRYESNRSDLNITSVRQDN
jgi:hypothetical protein